MAPLGTHYVFFDRPGRVRGFPGPSAPLRSARRAPAGAAVGAYAPRNCPALPDLDARSRLCPASRTVTLQPFLRSPL